MTTDTEAGRADLRGLIAELRAEVESWEPHVEDDRAGITRRGDFLGRHAPAVCSADAASSPRLIALNRA